MNKGKILALDYGEKKVGVAISDSSRQLCFIRSYIVNSGDLKALCSQIADLCEGENVVELIVGLPLQTNGTFSAQAEKNKQFSELLQSFLKIPVHCVDESFSTFEAGEIYKEAGFDKERFSELKDSLSAYVLLKKYILN